MNQSVKQQVESTRYREIFDAVTLSFVNKDVEQAFRADYYTSSLKQIRLALFFGCFLYAIFGVLDGQVIPEVKEAAWFIRYALICPLLLACIAFSYSSHFQKHFEPTLTLVGAVAGIGIITMSAVAHPPGSYLYYAGILLCSIFYFSFMRLRFITATCLAWTVFCVYEIAALTFTDIPAAYFINNTVFLLTFNISGMLICYDLEKHRRSDFLRRASMEEQAEQLKTTLDMLEERMRQDADTCRDPATSLFSRSYFLSVVELECNRYSRSGSSFSVLLLHIDNLQLIGDSFGHALAEAIVLAVGRRTVAHLRPYDVPCRYQDDRLAILLPDTPRREADMLAARLRRSMEKTPISTEKGSFSITLRTGTASVRSIADNSVATIIYAASQALHPQGPEGTAPPENGGFDLRSAS